MPGANEHYRKCLYGCLYLSQRMTEGMSSINSVSLKCRRLQAETTHSEMVVPY